MYIWEVSSVFMGFMFTEDIRHCGICILELMFIQNSFQDFLQLSPFLTIAESVQLLLSLRFTS